MQFDLFEHSRDVMLRNDALQALEQRDAAPARRALAALQTEYPAEPLLAALQALVNALEDPPPYTQPPTHAGLAEAREALNALQAYAGQALGSTGGDAFMAPFWRALAQHARTLAYHPNHETEHAVPLWLQLRDWDAALQGLDSIASWRRIPAPLAWGVRARLEALGLGATWPWLCELAWLAPRRLQGVLETSTEPVLRRLVEVFDDAEDRLPAAEVPDRLAWFPAWVLTEAPQHLQAMVVAQPGLQRAPEQTFRLLVRLLTLERQGRQRELMAARKELRELSPWLLEAYLRTR